MHQGSFKYEHKIPPVALFILLLFRKDPQPIAGGPSVHRRLFMCLEPNAKDDSDPEEEKESLHHIPRGHGKYPKGERCQKPACSSGNVRGVGLFAVLLPVLLFMVRFRIEQTCSDE